LADKTRASRYLITLSDRTEAKRLAENLRLCLNDRREAHEVERRRLSRKLHEEVLQDLLALAINLESMPGNCNGYTRSCPAAALARQARDMANYVRHMSHAIRPRILERMSLVEGIRTIVQETSSETMKCTLRVRGTTTQMPWYVESGIYRLTLELLSNARKHSKASHVRTILTFRKSDVVLTVEDDGIGFCDYGDTAKLARAGKHGVVGIYERAEYLGANLDFSSSPERGTRVSIVIPHDSEKVRAYNATIWPDVPQYLPTLGTDIESQASETASPRTE
jgi:two-component system, NarL family, sensor histidine kinase LiaS